MRMTDKDKLTVSTLSTWGANSVIGNVTPHAAVAVRTCFAMTALISTIYLNERELPAESAPRVSSIRNTDTQKNVLSPFPEAGRGDALFF